MDEDNSPTAIAARTPAGTGGGKIPALAAAEFGSPLALALLATADDRERTDEEEKNAAVMQAQNFALRFDRETGAYRHSQRLAFQSAPSLETNA